MSSRRNRIPVSARQIAHAMKQMGDDVLAAYKSGRISAKEAEAMTRRGLRQEWAIAHCTRKRRLL